MIWLAFLRHWKLALAGVLLIAVGVQTIRVERLKTVVERLIGKNKALRLDLDRIKEATEIADKKAREAKAKAEAEYRAKAERVDREYKAELADARARAARYAAANRVRQQAPGGAPGGTAAPADRDGPEGADGPGEGSGVVISRDDFDTLTENTIRLKKAREWACGLEGARCD